ncbi:hypothetical protein MHPYR_630022 [uncultured Mycobacterium sp.]|uniref:Uncharacterized protein n=1 Tax=uncultured Mycobacterium sp. TaxID=171292 RepID=A0A1Y5PJN2_9MYCO|nr:hypothetical protein MHPYR_630022 [uncultured Mycobacterium sp.]
MLVGRAEMINGIVVRFSHCASYVGVTKNQTSRLATSLNGVFATTSRVQETTHERCDRPIRQ